MLSTWAGDSDKHKWWAYSPRLWLISCAIQFGPEWAGFSRCLLSATGTLLGCAMLHCITHSSKNPSQGEQGEHQLVFSVDMMENQSLAWIRPALWVLGGIFTPDIILWEEMWKISSSSTFSALREPLEEQISPRCLIHVFGQWSWGAELCSSRWSGLVTPGWEDVKGLHSSEVQGDPPQERSLPQIGSKASFEKDSINPTCWSCRGDAGLYSTSRAQQCW